MNDNAAAQNQAEKKNKIVGMISKFSIIAVIVSFIWFGKWFIDYKTFDYKTTINEALDKFYVSSTVADLQPIVDLINAYEKEEEIVNKIQVHVGNVVGEWYKYTDNKYLCNKTNKMACSAQMEEFNILNTKLGVIHSAKANNGTLIIDPKGYVELSSSGTKKVKSLKAIVLSAGSSNPLTSQELYEKRCNTAVECESCRDTNCKCYFIDETDKSRNEITCKNPNPPSK